MFIKFILNKPYKHILGGENKMVKTKEKKGITLIALVITVIVLLILTGVSIAMLTGNNGILTQAKNAKKNFEDTSEKEQVQLAVQGSWNANGKIDINKLNKNLKEIEAGSEISISKLPNIIYLKDKRYQIDEDGKVSELVNDEYRTFTIEESEKIGINVDEMGVLKVNTDILNNYLQKNNGKLIIPSEIDGRKIKILSQALKGNIYLKEVVLSQGLEDIQWGAFQNCTNLEMCNIPNGVTHIGNWTFNGTNIKIVFIPESVTNIENKTTFLAQNIRNIIVDKNNNSYCDVNGLLLSKDKTTLITVAGGVQEITIPREVRQIKEYCFYDNRTIENVNIEKQGNLQMIGKCAFINNSTLHSITMPACFTTLDAGNFVTQMLGVDTKFMVGSELVKNILINYSIDGLKIDEENIIVDTSIN